MTSSFLRLATAIFALAVCSGLARGAENHDERPGAAAADALHWRLVGPMRGGWSTVVAGVPGQPDTYYFGAAGGGVWKSTDSGSTWHATSDSIASASIGALAIAASDPQTLYAGTGEVAARYDVFPGDGVYKSTDGGAHWSHVGLEATQHIGAIAVDPRDAGHVLVAALGHYFGPNPERGVFRSTDGGRTWEHALAIDANTGAVDLATDPVNPDIVYAAAWQVRNYPWLSYFTPNAGPGSGLYRSVDAGKTWTRISGHGWPEATLGRIGLAAAAGGRVYAVVNAAPYSGNVAHAAAKDEGGLYRSDDNGATWQRVSGESWLENDYFGRLAVDPADRDRVYATGQSVRRSDDGGAHWTIVKGAPGGDDYHFVWINPKDPQRMAVASDQGTAVTVNGGRNWSDWYNQPTGQFYHLAADDRFPYWIYSGQQDSGTVGIASRSDYGALGARDWHPVGGDERDYDVPDPQDPDIVYGSGLGGHLSRWDARTGAVQNISPWPVSSYGQRPTDFKYRYSWITPIAASPLAPYPLYQGAQVLFRSTDRGLTWKTISPDLSAKAAQPGKCAGNLAAPEARACGYGVIWSIGLSPRGNDEIWIGTDDGLIRKTEDGGVHWTNVTPALVPAWAKVSSLDVSAAAPGSVYAAIDNHRQDDMRPHVLRTRDGGKTWNEVDAGLPSGAFVSVVRADPKKSGLLYAGTNRGAFVSFDDGDHWQPLQRNLPPGWVRDLLVHGDDLIAATQGRALWILDDVAPLRQHERLAGGGVVLFDPAAAVRVRGSQNRDTPPPADTPLGQNPPAGALIDYRLPHDAHAVALEIRDASGNLVRRIASDRDDTPNASRYFTDAWAGTPRRLSASAGMHRFAWDLRGARPRAVHHEFSIAAVYGEGTPITPEGALVSPGEYQVTLDVDGERLQTTLTVRPDPRVTLDSAALRAGADLYGQIAGALDRDYVATGTLQAVDKQVDAARNSGNKAVAAAAERYTAATASLRGGHGDESIDLGAIGELLGGLAADLEATDHAPTQPQRDVLAATQARLQRAAAYWELVQRNELARLDAALKSAGLAPITLPAPDAITVADSPDSADLP